MAIIALVIDVRAEGFNITSLSRVRRTLSCGGVVFDAIIEMAAWWMQRSDEPSQRPRSVTRLQRRSYAVNSSVVDRHAIT